MSGAGSGMVGLPDHWRAAAAPAWLAKTGKTGFGRAPLPAHFS
jgi:hypothetical protein